MPPKSTAPKQNPDISFVITVFNKASYLPLCLQSLWRQCADRSCEFILVDDGSTDGSLAVIDDFFHSKGGYQIVRTPSNQGPARALNLGIQKASGRLLFLMDADDILATNGLDIMNNALEAEGADFVFGFQQKTQKIQGDLMEIELPLEMSYRVSTTPLETVLTGGYVRMAYLVTRDLFLKANGADPALFIQDESLPLRLAFHATKMVSLDTPAVYAPRNENSLSANKGQQFHDRFFAYQHAVRDFHPLSKKVRQGLVRSCVSTLWKAVQWQGGLMKMICVLPLYIVSKGGFPLAVETHLRRYEKFIKDLPHVRHVD